MYGPRAGVREVTRALHRGRIHSRHLALGPVVLRELVPRPAPLESPAEHDLPPLLRRRSPFQRYLRARHPTRAVRVRAPVPLIRRACQSVGGDELYRDGLVPGRGPGAGVGTESNDPVHEVRREDVVVDRIHRAPLALPDDSLAPRRAPRGPRRAVVLVPEAHPSLLLLELFRDAETAVVADGPGSRVASIAHGFVGVDVADVRFAAGHRGGTDGAPRRVGVPVASLAHRAVVSAWVLGVGDAVEFASPEFLVAVGAPEVPFDELAAHRAGDVALQAVPAAARASRREVLDVASAAVGRAVGALHVLAGDVPRTSTAFEALAMILTAERAHEGAAHPAAAPVALFANLVLVASRADYLLRTRRVLHELPCDGLGAQVALEALHVVFGAERGENLALQGPIAPRASLGVSLVVAVHAA